MLSLKVPSQPIPVQSASLNIDDADLSSRNKKIADKLALISAYYSMSGDKMRANAFSRASNQIAQWPITITSGEQAKKAIPGVGKSIQEAIDEFIATGDIQRLHDLENKFNEQKQTIDTFTSIFGIGPSSAVKFYNQGYRTLEDLWHNAPLTSAQKIGILWRDHIKLRIPYEEMTIINNKIGEILNPYGIKWAIVGSFRRKEPSSGDVDLLIESRSDFDMDSVVYLFRDILPPNTQLAKGEKLYMGIIKLSDQYNGHRLDIKFTDPSSYPFMLMHFTGSQQFNILMRRRANEFGLSLNEFGLFNDQNQSYPAFSEEDIFRLLRVAYVPPEQRYKNITHLTYL